MKRSTHICYIISILLMCMVAYMAIKSRGYFAVGGEIALPVLALWVYITAYNKHKDSN